MLEVVVVVAAAAWVTRLSAEGTKDNVKQARRA